MTTIDEQIRSADGAIVRNIETLRAQRDLLSQNVLAQLRNLIEGLIVRAHLNDGSLQFDYNQVGPALAVVRADANLNLLSRFHNLLQASASHYTLDGDPSERLMLKYYEYLMRTRDLTQSRFGLAILGNLAKFPIDLDPSLRDYYGKIAARMVALRATPTGQTSEGVYYIHSSRPFFVAGRIYYEVTFSLAHNKTSKFDRVIGFTDIDVTDKYAASVELVESSIDVLGQTMPVTLVRSWEVAIRGCEFNNFADLLGQANGKVSRGLVEYRNLMQYLTTTRSNLLDLVDMEDASYARVRTWVLSNTQRAPLIFAMLDEVRDLIRAKRPGSNLLRYLLLRMNNQVIKAQYDSASCGPLSNLHVSHSCRPFDTMPFCSSPRRHNPHFSDLAESLDASTRRHELLARRVRSNVEQNGIIYTPDAELDGFGDVDKLIANHNALLPPTAAHAPRKIIHANGHVFIRGYEDDTVTIINKLQAVAASGVATHSGDVQTWIDANPKAIDDDLKADALRGLFVHSKVALVYGAAGTGKSTMVDHIANYFGAERKLFLAHTNPAVDNLRRRVNAPNAEFSTITSHLSGWATSGKYDVLVIDECSTVSNASLLKVLENSSFDLLVLVGDVYQIESIEFGNWFNTIRSYLPATSVFELTKPYRTNDPALLTLWDRVRNLDDRIEESLSKNGYSTVLGDSLFRPQRDDEIVLCLNYDGLYGINNVNRFLQASNPNPVFTRRGTTYKVGDPVLFNDTNRFRGVIFNNLKGKIMAIEQVLGRITFDIELARDVTAADVLGTDLLWVEGSTVRFDVFDMADPDDDDDTVTTIVPFQIAYAVSFHKAQGLEFDSVKVVITDVNEVNVSHSIFYTAITRARERLEVFWTPEAQQRILSRLAVKDNTKDENLLKARRGITPVAKRPSRQKARAMP
ncbi:ATP-dependent RecD-like DNA helicase [Frigoribacterium sp. Leaf186]|uniref:ATP-dependent DNA helicase n=1 Tax=Frigoribacterium sp. Leaf186 TaxID=1736293 RepID=UPI0006FA7048|nr:ATP-dependent RecD-like DNA helicase [Frigoribacterium sp. Leaf186]KQS22357.1 helicase [Frigoribacterium sp. Leaf186]